MSAPHVAIYIGIMLSSKFKLVAAAAGARTYTGTGAVSSNCRHSHVYAYEMDRRANRIGHYDAKDSCTHYHCQCVRMTMP